MPRGTHPIYRACSGQEQQAAIPSIEVWVCCTILMFLCWMDGWVRAERVCNPTLCPRGCLVLGEALQGGQGAAF